MKQFVFIFLMLFVASGLQAQEVRIQLSLKDTESHRGIDAATVSVPYKLQRIKTNVEGLVYLWGMDGIEQRISISHLGYMSLDTVVRLQSGATIYIAMTPKNVQELPVVNVFRTGYQSIPKERQTGSFAQVSSELLTQQTGRSILDRLPTVTPSLMLDRTTATGTSTGLKVRGLSSINGFKEPLIVVDDFAYDGDFNNINPEDIESVTVLRDAAAASIWGAKAGNGVIVITTKKPQGKGMPKFRYLSNFGVSASPDLRYADLMTSIEFIEVERMLFDKNFYNTHFSSTARQALTSAVEILQQHRLGQIDQQAMEDGLGILSGYDGIADFEKYVYGNAMQDQNHIEAQGGDTRYNWLLSLGYDGAKDELAAQNRRFSARTFQRFAIAKNFSVELGLRYSNQQQTGGKMGLRDIRTSFGDIPPYERLVDADGQPRPIMFSYRNSYIESIDNSRLLDWTFVALDDHRYIDRNYKTKEFNFNPTVNYTHKSGLKLTGKYNYMIQKGIRDEFYNPDSYFARDMIYSYMQFDANGNPLYIVPMGGIKDRQTSDVVSHNGRIQLGYDKYWGIHGVNFLMGAEMLSTATAGSSQRLFGFNDENYTSAQVDLTKTYPHILTNRSTLIPGRNGISLRSRRFVSMFFNGSYSLLNKYIVSASLRRDASNFFGMTINDSWNPLGSVGLAWNIAEEPFFKSDLITGLKLRATYGNSGNINSNMVARTTIQYRGNSPITLRPMAAVGTVSNPSLRWERVSMANLAVDLNLRGDRLSMTVEGYRKKGTDLFGESPIDYTTGVGYYLMRNVAEMKAHGLDITINSKNIKGMFSWDSQLNWSYNTDEVTEYYLRTSYGRDFVGRSSNISAAEGQPVYGTYSYNWAGLDPQTGMPRGVLDGEISNNYSSMAGTGTDFSELIFHGSALPRFFGSLGNRFEYGNLSIDTRLVFKLNYFLRRQTVQYNALYNSHVTHGDYRRRWQNPGDEEHTDVPVMGYPITTATQNFYSNASPFVYDATHIRLQYVRLSYHFKVAAMGRRIDVNTFAHVDNLGIIWKKNDQGIDPDIEPLLGNFPQPRRVNFGFNINF